ncbi:hypothetical protein Btru_044642 [Bulinus truncatus]|nr:hypothetical protein Btru_044642 [Bulinus truncatus]
MMNELVKLCGRRFQSHDSLEMLNACASETCDGKEMVPLCELHGCSIELHGCSTEWFQGSGSLYYPFSGFVKKFINNVQELIGDLGQCRTLDKLVSIFESM